ncbi:SufD family Fe-S cluster assembly protein [bacterium]|nr:SufD family Fe-S cluster assembly protein [bacterium]
MDTKNVKNVCYWQINHKVQSILKAKQIIVLPSPVAWEKIKWARQWFKNKPKEGYFIWAKKQINWPVETCITIASKGAKQDLVNLFVIEKGLNLNVNAFCNTSKKNLSGKHLARGVFILKQGSSLKYNHLHHWGKNDFVDIDYQIFLRKGAQLTYNLKNFSPPGEIKAKTFVQAEKESSAMFDFVINGNNSLINLEDNLVLKGKDSQGIIRTRLVSKEKSQVKVLSKICAQAPSKGHLDCQGLLIGNSSSIDFVPELDCCHPQAEITHEASIGRISEEQLAYLRTRGLTEAQAIDLIVSGFLAKKDG